MEKKVRDAYLNELPGRFRNFEHFKLYYEVRHIFRPSNAAFRLFFKSIVAKGGFDEEK